MKNPTTTYNDASGKVAIDFHEVPGNDLQSLAKKAGIDTDTYTIIGFKFHQSTTITNQTVSEPSQTTTFYGVDKSIGEGHDMILDHITTHPDAVKELRAKVEGFNILGQVKRLEVTMTPKSFSEVIGND